MYLTPQVCHDCWHEIQCVCGFLFLFSAIMTLYTFILLKSMFTVVALHVYSILRRLL